MRVLALFLALSFWLIISLAIKAEIDFRYRRKDEEDHLEINLRALYGLWRFSFQVPTIKLAWEAGPELSVEQMSHSGAGSTKANTKARFRYLHLNFLLRLWPRLYTVFRHLQKVKTRFYRAIHCKALDWQVEIGYQDPVQTAIAAGTFWAVLGVSSARLYRQITMEVPKPILNVVPRFQTPGFSCDIHCIFQLRIGHIIFAGINLLRALRLG
ncbi:MAG: DUF2953 domain-containing protein [Desulfitobacteriaceae bacterium]